VGGGGDSQDFLPGKEKSVECKAIDRSESKGGRIQTKEKDQRARKKSLKLYR